MPPPVGQPVIAFVGAGSVVSTRDLFFDILATPELAAAQLRLHDIDAGRVDTAERLAGTSWRPA